MRIWPLTLLSTVFLGTLTGCAISEEGATEYRFFPPGHALTQDDVKTEDGNQFAPPAWALKYTPPAESKNQTIPINAALVISLKQFFIADIVELRSPLRALRRQPANGEVAIVVNAFERDGNNVLDFGPDGVKKGRVVFFSDDVQENQFLNLSNLSSIYGPKTYTGHPLVIDLYALELDLDGGQVKNLMSGLAALGSSYHPPSAPLTQALSQLGGTLIGENLDDRAMHFTLELRSDKGADENLHTGLLRPGHYVFIREHNRQLTTNWEQMYFDPHTARLLHKRLDCLRPKNVTINTHNQELPDDCYFRDKTYAVIEVNTTHSALPNDIREVTYSHLRTALKEDDAAILGGPEGLANAAEALAARSKQIIAVDTFNQYLHVLESNQTPLVRNRTAAALFFDQWFATKQVNVTPSSEESAPEGQATKTVSKHPLSERKQQQLLERLGNLISQCSTNATTTIANLGLWNNRLVTPVDTPPHTTRTELVTNIACRAQASP